MAIGSEGSQSGSLRLTACWTFQVEATNTREGRTMNGAAIQASEQAIGRLHVFESRYPGGSLALGDAALRLGP